MEILSFKAPPVNKKEILRYMKSGETQEVCSLIKECLIEAEKVLSYNLVYEKFPIRFFDESADNGLIDLCFAKVYSKDLHKNLRNFSEIILFAASVGIGIDRLIARYSILSPSKALCFQAIGAERVEALCDKFNDEIKAQYRKTAPRFSPGYGDLDLALQKEIFKALPMQKIGVSLGDSLLMSPSKSVTAIIGID